MFIVYAVLDARRHKKYHTITREYLHGNSINQVIYVLQFVLLLLLLQLRKKYETNNMKFIVAVIRHWVAVRAPDLSPTC